MKDRTNLCLTLKLAESVRIGEDVITVFCISDVLDFDTKKSRLEVLLRFKHGLQVWAKKEEKINFLNYSMELVRVHSNLIAVRFSADPSVKINRLKKGTNDELLPDEILPR